MMPGTAQTGTSSPSTEGPEPTLFPHPVDGDMLTRVRDTLSWQRPLRTLGAFILVNLLFWFLVLTPWRMYHLLSLILLGLVMVQIIKYFILSRNAGAQLWRNITKRHSGLD